MSRRDTIIVAVLANAALLMILFATGTRSEDEKKIVKTTHFAEGSTHVEKSNKNIRKEEAYVDYLASSVPTLDLSEEIVFNELPLPEAIIDSSVEEFTTVAVKEPKKTSSHQNNYVNVTVKKGDYLEKIANANETSVSAIMKANNLASTQLKVGQVLKVPVKEGGKTHAESKTSSQESFYIVKDGDNPWLIASRNQIKLDELLRLNGLDEQKARRLRPGDRLRIR